MGANSNNKAMEEALQAAVSRMNRPEMPGAQSAPALDPIGLLAAIVPKFLENRGEREAILEKIDEKIAAFHTDDLMPMREELRQARQQIHRLRKTQIEMMAILQQLSEQQTAVGDAVLDLAKQMARIQIVEPVEDVEEDVYASVRQSVQAAAAPRRTTSKPVHRVKKHQT